MPSKNYPFDIIEQARAVLEAWKTIDATVKIGDLDVAAMEAGLAQAGAHYAQIDSLESQITDARNQRDAHLGVVWDMVKRVRTGVKAIYGDDSSQYEMIGGTRLRDRKSPSRRQSAA